MISNDNLRRAGEDIEITPDIIQEFIKCSEDIIYFAEKYFYIINIDEGKQAIKLWDFQKKVLGAFVKPPNGKRHNIMMASRQVSKTTLTTIYILWYALFKKDKYIAIVANKEKMAIKILKRIKLAYEMLPKWLQAEVLEWNKLNVSLGNGTVMMAAATGSSSVRGDSVSLLYLDEFAFVPDSWAEDFMASVYPTISSAKTSQIIITSTPKGLNEFYNIWKRALDNLNDFYPIRVKWYEVPGRDENYKKNTIANVGIRVWRQEYSCEFVGSNTTLIDPDILEQLDFSYPKENKYNGKFLIYEKPIPSLKYLVCADVGKGLEKDYSVCHIIKIESSRYITQVGIYRANDIRPSNFAQILVSIAQYYNNADLVCEANDVGGITCDYIWNTYEYENLINFDGFDMLGLKIRHENKLRGALKLKDYVENRWLNLKDRDTIGELIKFVEIKPDIFKGENKSNDDCVMALIGAMLYLDSKFYDSNDDVDEREIDDKYKLDNDDGTDDDEGSVPFFHYEG